MRLGVGIIRNADGFGLHKGLEIGRNFLLLRHRLVATFAVFQVHDVGLVQGLRMNEDVQNFGSEGVGESG